MQIRSRIHFHDWHVYVRAPSLSHARTHARMTVHTRVRRPLHFHALRLIPAHSRLLTFDEYTRGRTRARVTWRARVRVAYTCTRWAAHKLTSLSRVARLLLAPRIARLHNGGGRSARFSSARELLTFPGFASLRLNATRSVGESFQRSFFFLVFWKSDV